jgi:hypothetical protein
MGKIGAAQELSVVLGKKKSAEGGARGLYAPWTGEGLEGAHLLARAVLEGGAEAPAVL